MATQFFYALLWKRVLEFLYCKMKKSVRRSVLITCENVGNALEASWPKSFLKPNVPIRRGTRMSAQHKQVTLSRFFNSNVQLVAKMCPICYEESADVKILSVNFSFLRQVTNNFQILDIKVLNALKYVNWCFEKENDEFFGFTEEDVDQAVKSFKNFNKIVDEHVEIIQKCLKRYDRNNNVAERIFLGFSCDEIDESKESYEKFVEISKLVRHKLYKRVSLCGARKQLHHRKTTRRKDAWQEEKKSKYFKRETNCSKYFSKSVKLGTSIKTERLGFKMETRELDTRIKRETDNFKMETCEHDKPDLMKGETELLDYESKYFKMIHLNQFLAKTLKEEDSKETKPTVWVPPRSPHNLIEEVLYHDPWALLVATIFLNRTSCMCARPYVFWFLTENPDPLAVLGKYPQNLERYFVKLGLQRTRALQVWRMSHDFVYKKWKKVKDLYGIGSYGEDAYRMFCQGDFDVTPRDRFLRIYKAWFEKVQMGGEDWSSKRENHKDGFKAKE